MRIYSENIMFAEDGMRVIDFDDAGYGWYLFDLVMTLFFLEDEEQFDIARETLISGYRQNRALSETHLSWLPVFFMALATT